MEQRSKVVRDIIVLTCMMYKMLRTYHGGADRAPTPADDIPALHNEQVVYMPDDNHRNPSREAKHQRELLVYWLGRRIGSEMGGTLGTEEVVIYQSFSGLPNYSKNFNLS